VLPKIRRVTQRFNNEWQKGRYLQVENLGFVEACQQRGINVVQPQDLFTSHLPEDPERVPEGFDQFEPTVKGEITNEVDHPHFHEQPIRDYNPLHHSFPLRYELDCAKVLLKTVEIEDGLPGRIVQSMNELRIGEDFDGLAKNVLMESHVYDATQKKLPKNLAVPYTGWHPVEDKMFRKMPYPVDKFSWHWGAKREYGIPEARKNQNMTRGLLRICDMMVSSPDLLNRLHLEETVIRQFLERGDDLLRFYVPLPFVITATKPLPAHADAQAVKKTENIPLPDIFPIEPHASFKLKYVYNDEVNFPLKPIHSVACAQHQIHSGIELNNSFIKSFLSDDGYRGQGLVKGFLLALGQAKLTFGPDVKGVLPSPVTVNFVHTDGQKFHFSAFQLNTLDLDNPEGVKNIYWCEKQLDDLYGTCDYIKAVPTLDNYNPDVLRKFAAVYLDNSM